MDVPHKWPGREKLRLYLTAMRVMGVEELTFYVPLTEAQRGKVMQVVYWGWAQTTKEDRTAWVKLSDLTTTQAKRRWPQIREWLRHHTLTSLR
jgi:hypothetical protein